MGVSPTSDVRRRASRGFTPPPGGELTVFALNTLTANPGVYARYYSADVNFNPSPTNKGLVFTGCFKRGVSGGTDKFAPFFFVMLQDTDVADSAYKLGLSDSGKLALVKGPLTAGIPDVAPGTQGVLLRSTAVYPVDTWVHVFLEAVVNESGGIPNDTVINVKTNNLLTNPLSGSPNWVVPAGMPAFIDDATGINSGTPGFTQGRAGWGMYHAESARRAFFDAFTITLQP